MRFALALCLLGCSSSNHPAPASTVKMTVTQVPPVVTSVEATRDDGIEELGVERLPVVRFTKNTVLRKQPDMDADEVGTHSINGCSFSINCKYFLLF